MKLVLISDTHGKHNQLNLPKGEMLIHAGDVSSRGTKEQVLEFIEWFSSQDYKYKIFIAGNHDFFLEKENKENIDSIIPSNINYLNDSGIEIEGIKIWGSPVQPWFYDWAFNRERGEEINKHWELIPEDTDILITHGPPFGILDETLRGERVGCVDLLNKVNLVKPKLHVFGHIHEDYGVEEKGETTYVNASVVNLHYEMQNKAVEIEI